MRQEANGKRYDAAKSYAAEAVSAAEKAISDGRAGAQRARDEAASLVATVKNSLVETQNSLDNAKRTGLDLDYASLDQDMTEAGHTVVQAEAASSPKEALEKGEAARAALSDIRTRLSQGVRGTRAKK
jgi:hypothetical protein